MNLDINPLTILFAAIFTNNIILSNFLGMCSFIALSKRLDTAFGIGFAVTFVSTFTSGLNWIIYKFIIQKGALSWILGSYASSINLEIFTFIIFIAVIAAFVQIIEIFIEVFLPSLHHSLGIYLPLITVNCAILGVSLFMIIRKYNFIQSVAYGFGAGIGWLFAIVMMAGIRKKLRFSKVPASMDGLAITLIITGMMAMVAIAFNGMVQIN